MYVIYSLYDRIVILQKYIKYTKVLEEREYARVFLAIETWVLSAPKNERDVD